MKKILLPILCLIVLGTIPHVYSAVPKLISYQGIITDNNGKAITDGNHTFTMRLYDTQNSQNPLYEETQNVTVTGGIFNIVIGSVTTIPTTIDFSKPYYLGIAIDQDNEMLPRTAITTSPYSMYSSLSESSKGLESDAKNAVNSVNGLDGQLQIVGEGGVEISASGKTIKIKSIQSGGSLEKITSDKRTIDVQNPNGPVTNLEIADNAVTTGKIAHQAVTDDKIKSLDWTKLTNAPNSFSPSGFAGGGLTGYYPNPEIANGAVGAVQLSNGGVTTAKLADGAVTNEKVTNVGWDKITNLPDWIGGNGKAGGSLTGNYPNPGIANGAIGNLQLSDSAVTDVKVSNVSWSKIINLPAGMSPSGNAGGSLTGTYPNPGIANGAVSTNQLSDQSVSTAKLQLNSVTNLKIADAAVTNSKISDVAWNKITGVPTGLPPTGVAGGSLTGNYPTPGIANSAIGTNQLAEGSVTNSKLTAGSVKDTNITNVSWNKIIGVPSGLPPSGSAGGSLVGTYPNPDLANGAVKTSTITDAAVTGNKIADATITDSKIVDVNWSKITGTPSLPPGGPAGGSLSGAYPNPGIAANAIGTAQIIDKNVTNIKLADGVVSTIKLSDGAVTNAKINDVAWSKVTGAPASLPPTGVAGGSLSGTYPNPGIAASAVGTAQIADQNVTTAKLSDGAVTNAKVTDVAWSKITGSPSSLPPSGAAGGDLSGVYPNPSVNKIQGRAVSTTAPNPGEILTWNGTSWTPAINTVSGSAGGSLTGTYPNPGIAANAVGTSQIADQNVTTAKLADGAVTNAKVTDVAWSKITGSPSSLPPNGSAGGDLSGSYPNPSVSKLQGKAVSTVTPNTGEVLTWNGTSWAPATNTISGSAGGSLTGTYPNPGIAANAISTTQIADQNVTTAKLADGAITNAKVTDVAWSKITGSPSSLPPNGMAGGDLGGTYPNPSVSKLQGKAVSTTAPNAGEVLTWNGTSWTPAINTVSGAAGGSLTGTYPNPDIAVNAVGTSQIADQNITTAKLADGAITNAKVTDVAWSKITGTPSALPPSGSAGGDLSGTYPNPAVSQLQGRPVANTAPNTNQVLGWDGASWTPQDGSGFTLPYSGSYSQSGNAFDLINSGTGAAMEINTNNSSNSAPALVVFTDGTGSAVKGINTGSNGNAGYFENTDANNQQPALYVTSNGGYQSDYPIVDVYSTNKGSAGRFTVNNTGNYGGVALTAKSNDGPGIFATNTGTDYAIKAVNNGAPVAYLEQQNAIGGSDLWLKSASVSGPVLKIDHNVSGNAYNEAMNITSNTRGYGVWINTSAQAIPLRINNGVTGSDAIWIQHIGAGAGLNLTSSGTGRAIDILNTSSNVTECFNALHQGSGLAGHFKNTGTGRALQVEVANNLSSADALYLTNNGSGTLIYGTNSGNGRGADIRVTNTSSSGDVVYTQSEGYGNVLNAVQNGGGRGISIQLTNSISTADALTINSSSQGKALNVSVSNTSSTSDAMTINTSAKGKGLYVYQNGSAGEALYLVTNSPNNTNTTLYTYNYGKGNAVEIWNNNASNNSDALYVRNNGSGKVLYSYQAGGTSPCGQFETASSAAGEAIYVKSAGSGNAVNILQTGSGQGLAINVSNINNSSDALNILTNGGGKSLKSTNTGSGEAAYLQVNNSSSSANAIYGQTNGSGNVMVLNYTGSGTSSTSQNNIAIFKASSSNVARIDNNGKGYFNGGTQNNGADVAEAFEVADNIANYEPGDVLQFSINGGRKVEKASQAYSTLVSGVVATKPGVLLTEKGFDDNMDNMVPMGVIGIIPTKVCGENGPIKIGDLLVVSSVPGYAMKADPSKLQFGMVIGKAIENFDGTGTSKIRVMVNVK